jgi:hypothetical protein
MKFIIEIIKGVIEYMKSLKEKIKQLIASGEDPELVRKLEEVLEQTEAEEEIEEEAEETEEEAEEEVVFIPSEIPLASEQFAEMRRLQAEKINTEHVLGTHYSNFHRQTNTLVQKISTTIAAFVEERKRIIIENAPEGMADEYAIAESKGDDDVQKLVLRRIEKPEEE